MCVYVSLIVSALFPVSDTLISLQIPAEYLSADAISSLASFTRLKRLDAYETGLQQLISSHTFAHSQTLSRLTSLTLSHGDEIPNFHMKGIGKFVSLQSLELHFRLMPLSDSDIAEIASLPLLSHLLVPFPVSEQAMHSLCSMASLTSFSLQSLDHPLRSDLMSILASSKIEDITLQVEFDDLDAALQHIARMSLLRELTVSTPLTNEQLLSLTHAPKLLTVTYPPQKDCDYDRVDMEAMKRGRRVVCTVLRNCDVEPSLW